jgi:RNase P subunit RPR2
MVASKNSPPRTNTENIVELKRTKVKLFLTPSQKKSTHYYCPFEGCNKTATKTNVMGHYCNVHLKEKRYACKICGWEDFYKKNVERHLETHEDVRTMFTCVECGVGYVRAGDLHCKHQRQTGHKGVREITFTKCAV